MTDDRRRFPWANAHRIADEHDAEVSAQETLGYADLAKTFPDGIVFLDGMTNPPGPAPQYAGNRPRFVVLDDQTSPAELDRLREFLADGWSPADAAKLARGEFVLDDLPLVPTPGRWRWERDPLVIGAAIGWDPLESTCRHASLSIL